MREGTVALGWWLNARAVPSSAMTAVMRGVKVPQKVTINATSEGEHRCLK